MSTNMTGNTQPQREARVWLPPPTVTGHAGEPLPPESDFLASPPAEIGEVKSAHTSLKKGVKAKPQRTRLILVAIWTGVGLLMALGIELPLKLLSAVARGTQTPTPLWFALIGALFGFISWRMTRFKHVCNYVGTEGCAEFVCKGAPENITAVKAFYFKDASAASTSVIRIYKNGSYRHTAFWYYWYPPASDKASYQISGRHYADLGNAPTGHPYNFARALETAWYAYLIPRADAELAQNGYITFYMGHKRWARLGRGFLEFVDKDGNISRCEAGDIGSAKLSAGTFTLTRKDSESRFLGLLAPSGVFRFDFGNMYNGRLFLYAFEKLLGIKLD